MTTSLALTLYLAQAIGLYLILVGVSALVAPGRWKQVMDEFAASPALTLITGVFVFALGAALIRVHSLLADPLAIAVTLVGWIATLEGALLIVVPHLLMRVGAWSMRYTRAWALVALVIGILLMVAGATGRVNTARFV